MKTKLQFPSGETDRGYIDMRKLFYRTIAATGTLLAPAAAFAHHPLAGAPMESFADGLLSGIGHPLLGFDHLFFVIAVGIAALFTARRFASPAAYIAAMLIGCFAMSIGYGLPVKEFVIAASLAVIGGAILRGKGLGTVPAVALFAGFGLFHGSAFGDTLASQEAAMGGQVLVGYLIGLGAIQFAIIISAGWVIQRAIKVADASDVRARLAGAMVAGIGAFLILESLEGAAFAALSIAN